MSSSPFQYARSASLFFKIKFLKYEMSSEDRSGPMAFTIWRFAIEWVECCGVRVEIKNGRHGKGGSGILSASIR